MINRKANRPTPPNANRSNFDVGGAGETCNDMPDTSNHLFISQSVIQTIGLVIDNRYHVWAPYAVRITCTPATPLLCMGRPSPQNLISNNFNLIALLRF